MKLKRESIEWALTHVFTMKDTDLFSKPVEIEILYENFEEAIDMIANIDMGNYQWKTARRFIIPKKELSYRLATQLDPIDSILFAGLIYEFGQQIEDRRIGINENKVFSYRFSPNKLGYIYTLEDSWRNFWNTAEINMYEHEYAVCLDISDFYNQIYHHTVENELIISQFPNEITKSIMKLLEELTTKTSRGIPIGPHCSHLLAEMTLIPIDSFINVKYGCFCRYADDIVIFCDDYIEAQTIVYEMAEFIDGQQRLVLNTGKTKIYKKEEFVDLCNKMSQDNPINELEVEMVYTLDKYDVNLYTLTQVINLSDEDMEIFSKEKIEECLDSYLSCDDPNFERIKWLYRRLSQIRVETAVEYTVGNLHRLMPAISEIIHYLVSVGESEKCNLDLNAIGDMVFTLYKSKLVQCNPYLKISLISLFASTNQYNHIRKLIELYKSETEEVKREILIACYKSEAKNDLYSWVYSLKEHASNYADWTRRAYYVACSYMAPENKKFYFKTIKTDDILEKFLIRWALNKKD